MDKILPILPLFTFRGYQAVWSNTKGYDIRWGFVYSAPYMTFDGYHHGQTNISEFNDASGFWLELNPLFIVDGNSADILQLIDDAIIVWSPDMYPLKTGLVHNWEQIDDSHYKFYMRDNIFWNPSVNVTERDIDSPLLSSIPSSELMKGLKNDEYSDGTNQQITAMDAVFTYLTQANYNVSNHTTLLTWISDIYVDPNDELAFHIHIDGDYDTPEIESYADFWSSLSFNILPEFFLNSTNPSISSTSGGVDFSGIYQNITKTPQWTTYSISAFGCGPFMMDYYILNLQTVLRKSPFWNGIGKIDGSTDMEPFVDTVNLRVIGDYTSSLAEFKAGKLDIVGLTAQTAERKEMQSDSRFTVFSTAVISTYSFVLFNLMRPFIGGASNYIWLDEPGKEDVTEALAVRKAICYSIDRDEMNSVFFDETAIVQHSCIPPSIPYYYYDDIIKYNQDLDAALEWLKAAGYYIEAEENPLKLLSVVASIGVATVILMLFKKSKRH